MSLLFQVRLDALLKRQYDLIACLVRVDKLGKAATVNSATAGLLEDVKQQLMGSAAGGEGGDAAAADEVQVLGLIGTGSFGKVYKGMWKGSLVAVKYLMLPSSMSGADKYSAMAVIDAAISLSFTQILTP